MRMKTGWLSGVVVMLVLGFAVAGAPLAQTTTKEVNVRNFEILLADGNRLYVRDERGTSELTVPPDFKFTVDGKQLSASDLKTGMKGTAVVTTTTTVRPVYDAEMREGEVMRASDQSITVKQGDDYKRFNRGDLAEKGIQIYKDGKPVVLGDLKKGDKLTAIIITSAPGVVLTQQEVQATLAAAPGQPAPTTMAAAPAAAPPAATPAAAAPAPTTVAAAPATPAAATPAAPPAASPTPPPAEPAAATGMSMTTWLLIAIAAAILLFFFLRRKKEG